MKFFIAIFFQLLTPSLFSQTAETEKGKEFKFQLENIKEFFPENKFDAKNPKILKVTTLTKEDKKEIVLFKYYDSIYPLIINAQLINSEITDIYVRFPNNFPHNLVLFNIREHLGKMDRNYTQGSNALFTWVDKTLDGKNVEVVYHSSCSLSCFPLGLYIISKKAQKDPSFTSLYQKFNKDFPKSAY